MTFRNKIISTEELITGAFNIASTMDKKQYRKLFIWLYVS